MIESLREDIRAAEAALAELADATLEATAEAARILIDVLRAGRTVYLIGDGGSAAQAQHVAGELVGRFLVDRAPLPCVALTTDTSVLTAIGNDYSFETVFERQVEALVREGDVLWCLSTSGGSANVLKAASAARRRGARVLGMTGRGGGKLRELSDVCIAVPADGSPRVQEGHLVLIHALCREVEAALCSRPEPQPEE